MRKLLFLSILALVGCQTYNADDDFRTVPVTNNPNVVPKYGNGLAGMGGGGQGPY